MHLLFSLDELSPTASITQALVPVPDILDLDACRTVDRPALHRSQKPPAEHIGSRPVGPLPLQRGTHLSLHMNEGDNLAEEPRIPRLRSTPSCGRCHQATVVRFRIILTRPTSNPFDLTAAPTPPYPSFQLYAGSTPVWTFA